MGDRAGPNYRPLSLEGGLLTNSLCPSLALVPLNILLGTLHHFVQNNTIFKPKHKEAYTITQFHNTHLKDSIYFPLLPKCLFLRK